MSIDLDNIDYKEYVRIPFDKPSNELIKEFEEAAKEYLQSKLKSKLTN